MQRQYQRLQTKQLMLSSLFLAAGGTPDVFEADEEELCFRYAKRKQRNDIGTRLALVRRRNDCKATMLFRTSSRLRQEIVYGVLT